MDLYYMDASAPCRSVMLMAKEVGVTLNKKRLDLMKKEQMTPEFLAINPQHCIPTLVDGDFVLWESRPICTYLASEYGKGDSLYPKDPKIRAQIDRLLYFDMGTLFKRFGDYVFPVALSNEKPDPAKLETAKLETLHEALGWLNGFLEGHSFCVGKNVTVADFVLIASVSTFIEAGIDCSKYANVTDWVERCKTQMTDYDTENNVGAKQFGSFIRSKLNA